MLPSPVADKFFHRAAGDRLVEHRLFAQPDTQAFQQAGTPVNGFGDSIHVTLHKSGDAITVQDNGRGIPVDKHPKLKKSGLEVVLTVLHALTTLAVFPAIGSALGSMLG